MKTLTHTQDKRSDYKGAFTHHEGTCTFDDNERKYSFVVNLYHNASSEVRIYTAPMGQEDLLWWNGVATLAMDVDNVLLSDIHHTITIHHYPIDDDEIFQQRPTEEDLHKIQEVLGLTIME